LWPRQYRWAELASLSAQLRPLFSAYGDDDDDDDDNGGYDDDGVDDDDADGEAKPLLQSAVDGGHNPCSRPVQDGRRPAQLDFRDAVGIDD